MRAAASRRFGGRRRGWLLAGVLLPGMALAAGPAIDGDLGAGIAWSEPASPAPDRPAGVVPYAYFDWGRAFVREDTFGWKLWPAGRGAVELVARVSREGAEADVAGRLHRTNPRPVGLGTFQETPWGGIFADAFVDTVSGGTLLEASDALQAQVGTTTIYPQAGFAWRDARYRDHLYAVAPGRGPGAGLVPWIALSTETPLGRGWVLVAHLQRERFDPALARATGRAGRIDALVALARRFP